MAYIKEIRKLIGNRPIIMPAAGVIIINEKNQILMHLRSDNHCWGIPGGAIEPGENIEECAKREVFEEVGITINYMNFFNIYSGKDLYYKYPNGDEVYIISGIFISSDYSGEISFNDEETLDAKFYSIKDLPLNINPPDKFILEDVKRKFKS